MIMKNVVKNEMELSPIALAEMVSTMTNHPFGAFKTLGEDTSLSGGKKTLALFNGQVYKYTHALAMTNIQYHTAIKNKLEKYGIDDTFQHEPHKWMDRVFTEDGKITSLGYHRADAHLPLFERRLYLVLSFLKVFSVEYFDGNLQPISKEAIKPYLVNKDSAKQLEAGIPQDDQIIYRGYKIENLREISINGTIYTIVA